MLGALLSLGCLVYMGMSAACLGLGLCLAFGVSNLHVLTDSSFGRMIAVRMSCENDSCVPGACMPLHATCQELRLKKKGMITHVACMQMSCMLVGGA